MRSDRRDSVIEVLGIPLGVEYLDRNQVSSQPI